MIENLEKIRKKPIIILPIFASVFLVVLFITFSLNTYSLPVESISFPSSSLSYEEKVPGAWNVTKSAKLTNKGKVRVTIDMDTLSLYNNEAKDVILVLDTSIQ